MKALYIFHPESLKIAKLIEWVRMCPGFLYSVLGRNAVAFARD